MKLNPVIRNILAVIVGLILGGLINMGIVMISASVIPPPEGADLTTMEGLKASMHLMEPRHFLMPFLAHALGTLIGAFLAAVIAANHKMIFALAIGCMFLLGGIINVLTLPSPAWFTVVDLVGAYIPMGYLGWLFAAKITEKK